MRYVGIGCCPYLPPLDPLTPRPLSPKGERGELIPFLPRSTPKGERGELIPFLPRSTPKGERGEYERKEGVDQNIHASVAAATEARVREKGEC